MLHIAVFKTIVESFRKLSYFPYKLIAIKLFEEHFLQVEKKIIFLWVSSYMLNILRMIYTSKTFDKNKYFLHIYHKYHGKVETNFCY